MIAKRKKKSGRYKYPNYYRYEHIPNGRFSSLAATEKIKCDLCDELATRFEPIERVLQINGGEFTKKRPRIAYCQHHYEELVVVKWPKKLQRERRDSDDL